MGMVWRQAQMVGWFTVEGVVVWVFGWCGQVRVTGWLTVLGSPLGVMPVGWSLSARSIGIWVV